MTSINSFKLKAKNPIQTLERSRSVVHHKSFSTLDLFTTLLTCLFPELFLYTRLGHLCSLATAIQHPAFRLQFFQKLSSPVIIILKCNFSIATTCTYFELWKPFKYQFSALWWQVCLFFSFSTFVIYKY